MKLEVRNLTKSFEGNQVLTAFLLKLKVAVHLDFLEEMEQVRQLR